MTDVGVDTTVSSGDVVDCGCSFVSVVLNVALLIASL